MNKSNNIDETLIVINQVLIRCFFIGFGLLIFWWGAIWLFGDLAHTVHSIWIPITLDQFHMIHYTGMLTTKVGVSVLFFFPYIAIRMVLKKRAQ